jgi:hypothetical protein
MRWRQVIQCSAAWHSYYGCFTIPHLIRQIVEKMQQKIGDFIFAGDSQYF